MVQSRPEQPAASTLDGSYPRPQLVRSEWASLDGPWEFGYDDDDVGVAQGWFDVGPETQTALDREIVVPFPPESPASGIHDQGFHPIVWYRCRLLATDIPTRRSASDRVLLNFGAVDYRATVWFDGVPVGEHVGGQTPFAVDVTGAWSTGADEHWIVVRAYDDSSDAAQPTGKQDWRLEPHNIWYYRTTGIWQSVWAEVVPDVHIVDLAWIPDVDARSVRCEVRLSDTIAMRLVVTLSHLGRELSRSAVTSGGRASIDIDLADLAPDGFEDLLWRPGHPALVDAGLTLRSLDATTVADPEPATDPVDKVSSYFGLRSVAVTGGRFVLNGQPCYLRSVLDQGYWHDTHLANAGSDWLRREVELILELGFNAVRLHQKAEDPRFLFWADRLGLMVWAETANARTYSDRAVGLLTQEWADLVRRDRSHPCIVTWVPLNESWGIDEVAVSDAQKAYAIELTRLTRTLDPTRPVISNDGWEHVDSDIIGIHDYTARTWRLRERYGGRRRLRRTLRSRGPARRRLVVADEQWQRLDTGDVAVMLSEFGGVKYAGGRDTWGYSSVSSHLEYAAALRRLFDTVRECRGLSGFCYTQLLDTVQEANGLLTSQREPKLPIATIREIVVGGPEPAK